jgi:predicted flap endonuclease-1-like 5' DNA nuclease
MRPTMSKIIGQGAKTLREVAAALTDAGIQTPRGLTNWNQAQVKRTLDALGIKLRASRSK